MCLKGTGILTRFLGRMRSNRASLRIVIPELRSNIRDLFRRRTQVVDFETVSERRRSGMRLASLRSLAGMTTGSGQRVKMGKSKWVTLM
jgi:hypothetical protein